MALVARLVRERHMALLARLTISILRAGSPTASSCSITAM
jgi:hypothetical protein